MDPEKTPQRNERASEEVRQAWSISFLRFGIIGFSIMIPALIGAILGMALDVLKPGPLSWSIVFIIAGLALGFFMTWKWMVKEIRRNNQIR